MLYTNKESYLKFNIHFSNSETLTQPLANYFHASAVSGETLEVEVNELMQGLQDIQKSLEDMSPQESTPGDKFNLIMSVS